MVSVTLCFSANHKSACGKIGADVCTAPPNVIKAMANHVLTDKGLAGFMADVEKAGIKILQAAAWILKRIERPKQKCFGPFVFATSPNLLGSDYSFRTNRTTPAGSDVQ